MINSILEEDLEYICYHSNVNFSKFKEKTILVTGATGLIGFNIVCALLYYGKSTKKSPKVIAVVRNIKKAKKMFEEIDDGRLKYIVSDITKEFQVSEHIDYIIHGASQTSSRAFIKEPVETINTAIYGTINMLELAREKHVDAFIYLSSMEVYGAPLSDEKIGELHSTNLNTMTIRASYPESKRMCESICCSYCSEYGVAGKVVRLTQTFGPGVTYNDERVFAEFARCAIEGRNIILHTKGETKRNYLYTADAVTAILTVLINGEIGEAYNVANEETYCSIYEMANMVAEQCAASKIKVVLQIEKEDKFGFAPTLKMNLDTTKLTALGWLSTKSLSEMFDALIYSMVKTV